MLLIATAGVGGGSSGLATGGGYIPGATSGSDLAYNNALLSSQGAGITNSAVSGASGAMDVDKLLAAGNPIGGLIQLLILLHHLQHF
jgi:hypothetical protein